LRTPATKLTAAEGNEKGLSALGCNEELITDQISGQKKEPKNITMLPGSKKERGKET